MIQIVACLWYLTMTNLPHKYTDLRSCWEFEIIFGHIVIYFVICHHYYYYCTIVLLQLFSAFHSSLEIILSHTLQYFLLFYGACWAATPSVAHPSYVAAQSDRQWGQSSRASLTQGEGFHWRLGDSPVKKWMKPLLHNMFPWFKMFKGRKHVILCRFQGWIQKEWGKTKSAFTGKRISLSQCDLAWVGAPSLDIDFL